MSQIKYSAMGSSALSNLLRRRAFSTSTSIPPTTQPPAGIKALTEDLYSTRNPKMLAQKFMKASENDGFRRNTGVYEEVVRRLSIAGRYKLVKKILEDQKKYEDVSREGFCVRLISLYGRSGMLGHAIKVFYEMPKWKSERTVKSFNALLAAGVNSRKYGKVEPLFRELPEKLGVQPDVISYNTVIKAFCEMGSLDLAVSMLDEMEKKGCKADRFTFNTLLHGLYGGNRFQDAEKIWDKMHKYGVVPDIRSYNAKLAGLASEKKAQQAADLLEDMKEKGMNPDLFSFNPLIKGYCNEGNLVEATRWYDELRRNGCKPDKVTYATLLPSACEKGDLDLALRLCKNIFHDRSLVHGALLQRVVDELVRCSKIKEANEVLELANSNNYCDYKLKLPSAS